MVVAAVMSVAVMMPSAGKPRADCRDCRLEVVYDLPSRAAIAFRPAVRGGPVRNVRSICGREGAEHRRACTFSAIVLG